MLWLIYCYIFFDKLMKFRIHIQYAVGYGDDVNLYDGDDTIKQREGEGKTTV